MRASAVLTYILGWDFRRVAMDTRINYTEADQNTAEAESLRKPWDTQLLDPISTPYLAWWVA